MNNKMPIVDMMQRFVQEGNVSFHMPGHKGGEGFKGCPEVFFLEDAGKYDLTEVQGTDNLNNPELGGAIEYAQDLCAEAYGADETLFCVNGSTVGLWAVIGAAFKAGDKVIVSRDCHGSVINAMTTLNIEPVFIFPEDIDGFNIISGTLITSFSEALAENPDAAGVILTRPTYYGVCCDIEAISKIVHEQDKVLIVDEAHGAHLAFGGELYPQSAVEYADACVQSAHKTLAALNQGSFIHLKGTRISKRLVRKMLSIVQTSSPSYLIMASLDYSRSLMETQGFQMLEELHGLVNDFIKYLDSLGTGFRVLSKGDLYAEFELCTDRLVINVSGANLTGYEVERQLRNHCSIQVEMSDLSNVVLLCTIFNKKSDFEKLLEGLKLIWDGSFNQQQVQSSVQSKVFKDFSNQYRKSRKRLKGEGLFFKEVEDVPLNLCVGRYAGEAVTPYPPGIPFIAVGEYIDEQDVDLLSSPEIKFGNDSASLACIKCVED